jgi:hypothetical protein
MGEMPASKPGGCDWGEIAMVDAELVVDRVRILYVGSKRARKRLAEMEG